MNWWAKVKGSTELTLLAVLVPVAVVLVLAALSETGVLDQWVEFLEGAGG